LYKVGHRDDKNAVFVSPQKIIPSLPDWMCHTICNVFSISFWLFLLLAFREAEWI
jgi:hypothetical protein